MKRRVSREIALQSLYQLDMNDVTPQEAMAMAIEEAEQDNEASIALNEERVSPDYIKELVEETHRRVEEIDRLLVGYLKGWTMDRLSRVDRQVLRLAVYEMVYREDVPPKVVINEAIELVKHFGSEESGKFVNGVLGRMIKELDELKLAANSQA